MYRREEIRGQENTFALGAAPSGRHPTQRRGSASSARPHARNEADTCARGRGRGERTWAGRVLSMTCRPFTMCPGLAPGGSAPDDDRFRVLDDLRNMLDLETNVWFLQASARACSSSRHAWAGGRARLAWPVGDRAGRGSAHDRARVRARAYPRARQRVRRRLSASRHGLARFKRLFRGVEPARTLLKVPTPWTFFSLLLAKPRLGAV